jgi:beta-glucosidase
MPDFPRLPAGFRFGMATAAIQIEGATAEDGRGPSIWDGFAARPGAVRNGDTPRIATDHYHRFAADVTLIADAGVQDYRFSIAWPRVFPEGTGTVNTAGLDFYDRLVDALLAAGVRPMPTLYHWDLPQPLQDAGGWMVRETVEAFAVYAAVVAERLADRVEDWMTLNEMNVHTLYGHALTAHPPALGLGRASLPAAHHQLLGHGRAVAALRAAGARRVGLVSQHFPVTAASSDPADVEAAETFAVLTNWTFSDPILRGRYPHDDVALGIALGAGLNEEQLAADLAVICAPLDFYGVNYYEPLRIEAPRTGRDYSGVLEVDIPTGLPFSPVPFEGVERTDFGWAIVPSGLRAILRELDTRYPELPPIIVTECGASFHDEPGPDGKVHDERRIRFLDAHLRAVADAVADGVDVRGFYVWSALDNFEWSAGYQERFGLIHVDWKTLARTRKASWYWYRDLIAAQHRAAVAAPGR